MPLTYNLDEEHQQLSLDVVELNNVVLNMRPLIKKAKVLVLRELAIYIKHQKVKQSKAPKDKAKRLGRKIVNRLSEVRLLKKFDLTKLCKLVLANVHSRDLLERNGESLTKQDRIVVRLSARPEISKFVENFRHEHSDWPTLIHYLLYKNTSGKWKTSEQKRKVSKKKKGDLPFPDVDIGVTDEEHVESTIRQFKAFKEAHDRELVVSQRRILAEEKVEGKASNSGSHGVEEDEMELDPADNPEMKTFISNLLDKVNKGEEIDESLLPGSDLEDLSPQAAPMEISIVQEDRHGALKPENKDQGRMKEKNSKLEQESGAVMISPSPEEVEKKTPRKANRRTRRLEKSKQLKQSSDTIQRSKVTDAAGDDDGMLHEVIIEDEADAFVEDNENEVILGCDDVEMKQELKERKARPGDSAVYKRYIKQRKFHSNQSRSQQSTYRRGALSGNRKRPFKLPPTPIKEAPLHPSWEAKRRQKAMLNKPIKIVVD
ncbi:hypothetical protein Aperf_G00000058410 [Anoplocephala perfoliata]